MTFSTQRNKKPAWRRIALSTAVVAVTIGATACGHLRLMAGGAERPAAAEFGLGPRPSAAQLYTATLLPRQPLRLRQLETVPVRIADASGRPVAGVAIAVSGGMPEHGHGLPTQPRVTRALGDGVYEIEGVRFSMGGWWQLKLAIESPAGADSVTFNLSL